MIKVHRLSSVIGAHAHEVAFATHHIDQLELLEEGSDGRKAFANLWPCFDGDTKRRRIVECETKERVPDRPLGKVGNVEVEAFQVRQQNLPILVSDREVVPATVVEVADAGQTHMVAINNGSWHYCDFRSPVPI